MDLLLIIWCLVGAMMVGIAFVVHNKKNYSLISGYSSYTEEEKKELEKNGYTRAVGRFCWTMAVLWIMSIPFIGFHVSYSIEVFVSIFLLYTMIGSLNLTRYDVKRTKKRNRIILSVTYVIVIVGIGVLFFMGEQATNVTITADKIELEGMYDDTILISDIEKMELIDHLPNDTIKSNGYATETRSLGAFHSKKLGPGRHHVFTKYPPYIFIVTKDKYYLLNSKKTMETKKWFDEIEAKLK